MQNRPFCIHLPQKKRIGMQNAEFCIPISQKTYVLSESVADAETHALPAETGGRNEIEHGAPVKRNLKREAGEDVLETYWSNLEVIGCADAYGVCAPTNADTECAGSRPPSCRWSG